MFKVTIIYTDGKTATLAADSENISRLLTCIKEGSFYYDEVQKKGVYVDPSKIRIIYFEEEVAEQSKEKIVENSLPVVQENENDELEYGIKSDGTPKKKPGRKKQGG